MVIGNWFLEKSLPALSGCSRFLAVHKKSVVEQGFIHEFAFDNKALKRLDEFRMCCKHSKFEHCRIRIRTSSHLYYRETAISVPSHYCTVPKLYVRQQSGMMTGHTWGSMTGMNCTPAETSVLGSINDQGVVRARSLPQKGRLQLHTPACQRYLGNGARY